MREQMRIGPRPQRASLDWACARSRDTPITSSAARKYIGGSSFPPPMLPIRHLADVLQRCRQLPGSCPAIASPLRETRRVTPRSRHEVKGWSDDGRQDSFRIPARQWRAKSTSKDASSHAQARSTPMKMSATKVPLELVYCRLHILGRRNL